MNFIVFKNRLPTISIVIPTLNSAKTLGLCLKSIAEQDYPRRKIEILVIDGGSKDETIKIAMKHNVKKILHNPLKTGEAGKALGVSEAGNEIIALIDSDNILNEKNWLKKMTEPFNDKKIVGSEPLYYTYRREDSFLTRYCALVGMNDVLCLYLGNYDRYCLITNRWTELKVRTIDKGSYLSLVLDEKNIPTMGANGFLVRTHAAKCLDYKPYLFDIDFIYELIKNGYNEFAKVKIGIIHLFADDIGIFIRKTYRRVRDYLFYERQRMRKYPWKRQNFLRMLKFALYTMTLIPISIDSIRGYRRLPDKAWFFHLVACWLTLLVYGISHTLNGMRDTSKVFQRFEGQK